MNKNNLGLKVALDVLAKERPRTLFEGIIHSTKELVKEYKEEVFERARRDIYSHLLSDLKSLGIPIHLLEVKLGKFRGHPFITSSKVEVKMKDEKTANKFLKVLNNKYSPKFKLKSFSNGLARFNIR